MTPGHVVHLMKDVSSEGESHLGEVVIDLRQTDVLLHEAVQQLSSTFLAMHTEMENQNRLLAAVPDGLPLCVADRQTLYASQQRVTQLSASAITSLQFQDMVSQVIERTLGQVAGVRRTLAELECAAGLIENNANEADVEAALASLHHAVMVASHSLRKTVHQRHMNAGPIELY